MLKPHYCSHDFLTDIDLELADDESTTEVEPLRRLRPIWSVIRRLLCFLGCEETEEDQEDRDLGLRGRDGRDGMGFDGIGRDLSVVNCGRSKNAIRDPRFNSWRFPTDLTIA